MAPPQALRRMKYGRCTNNELHTFCTARGVAFKVVSESASDRQKRMNRKATIQALEDADADPGPFRFLDLAPELRTTVYEDLLVFNNSFTCWPQILAASKAVNKEASNILYGDNLIEVKLWDDGPHVHGKRKAGRWPDFLRRVQFPRVSYGSPATARRAMGLRPSWWEISFGGLCQSLLGTHNLRSMTVSFAVFADNATFNAPFDVYALRMLGPLKHCVIEGVDGAISDYQAEAEAPLRLRGPDGRGDAAWQEFYRVCFEKWNKFLVKWHRSSGSLRLESSASWMVAVLLRRDVKTILGKILQQGYAKEPADGRTSTSLVETKYRTLFEAKTAFYGGFLRFSKALRATVAVQRIPEDFPGFLVEFEKFCIDVEIARHLIREPESDEW